jgi:hypothetical protein
MRTDKKIPGAPVKARPGLLLSTYAGDWVEVLGAGFDWGLIASRARITGPSLVGKFVDFYERATGGGTCASHDRGVGTGGESDDDGGVTAAGRERERTG